MLKKLIILIIFCASASVYFTYGIIEGWREKEEHKIKIKIMENLYADQQEIEKRIKEIESRRDELEATMVRYMRDIDRRLERYKEVGP